MAITNITIWEDDAFGMDLAAAVWRQDEDGNNTHQRIYRISKESVRRAANLIFTLTQRNQATVRPWLNGGLVGWSANIHKENGQ